MWAKIFTRKFSKNTCRRSIHQEIKPLKPEDFDDIFGGPPRCVFSRHSSVDPSDDNMFHSPVRHSVDKNFRKLPEFKIFSSISNSGMPRKMAVPCGEEFDEVRRSKLDTTSVLNSESEFSPPTSEDDDYSKLRLELHCSYSELNNFYFYFYLVINKLVICMLLKKYHLFAFLYYYFSCNKKN